MVKNSSTVFVFWKFSDYYLKLFEQSIIASEIRLRVFDENNLCFVDIPVKYYLGGSYINLPRFAHRIRIGIFCLENGVEKSLCFSDEIPLSCEKEIQKDYSFYNEKN